MRESPQRGTGLMAMLLWLAIEGWGAAPLCPQTCTCQEMGTPANGGPGLDVYCQGPITSSASWDNFPVTRMLKLNLSACHLHSFRRTAWPKLLSLKLLDLSWNSIPSSQMEMSVIVPNLLSLNVSGNALQSISFSLPRSLKLLVATQNALPNLDCGDLKNIPDVEALYLDFNAIQNISNSEGKKLHKLRTLSLSHNRMNAIGREFSLCFSNIEYLNLAGNKLRHITVGMFQNFVNLQYLDLSDNLITSVAYKALQSLGSLRYLNLSGNRLRQLQFSLPLLEWVDFSFNLIHSVTESQTQSLYMHEVFLIGGNPLHCNCSLVPLKELYDTREYQVNFLSVNKSKFIPVCASPPHLAGESWDVLGDAVFECESPGSDTLHAEDLEGRPSDRGTLSFRAVDITASSILLKWVVLQNPGSSIEKQFASIHVHPFGGKSLLQSYIVPWIKGAYTLENLSPGTSYVVCMDNSHSSTENSIPKHSSHCLELVTEREGLFADLNSWKLFHLMVTGVVIAAMSGLLLSNQFRFFIVFHWNRLLKNYFVCNKSVDESSLAQIAANETCDESQDAECDYREKQNVQ